MATTVKFLTMSLQYKASHHQWMSGYKHGHAPFIQCYSPQHKIN